MLKSDEYAVVSSPTLYLTYDNYNSMYAHKILRICIILSSVYC